MGKTREIKLRIKAVGNIRRITKTMQMIATAKFAAAQSRATATKPYTKALMELVAELAQSAGDVTHPLARSDGKGTPLTLVVTSDRGLCGAYNSNVLRAFKDFYSKTADVKGGVIELVGRKGVSFLRFNKVEVSKLHAVGDKPTYESIQAIAQQYIDRFASGELSSVRVVYMKFLSAGRQTPDVVQLLPFQAPKTEKKAEGMRAEYEFSPSAEELMGSLLPAAVKASLFQAFNDAIVSEHVSRMIAMKSATDNAGKMGKALTRKFNRARQAQITTELTEIIAGAAALG